MNKEKCQWSAEEVFKDLIETSLVLIDDESPNETENPRTALMGVLEQIILSDKSGLASSEISTNLPINFIPGKFHGNCYPILFSFCYDGDDFGSRMKEILNHTTVLCSRKNKLVAIFTSQWDITQWKSTYLNQFEQIYSTVHIYVFGPSGIAFHAL